ncbi:DUF4232 domain-containing protein [Streptomyces sp. SBT349]|uniref:DUF4232 domain-containing protein n=1 Tax=Streptomyces sp. SBT349 TaxID=1580539 RepID=UPI00066A45F7|nr:DUF4232 domain-containing protein [Streptomyces sp. SBT349]
MASHSVRSAALAALTLLAVAACAESTDSAGDAGSASNRTAERPAAPDNDTDTENAPDTEENAPADEADRPGAQDREGEGTAGAGQPAWCSPDALSAAVTPLSPGAGNRYAALVLTNDSGDTCRTQGWPGLQLTAGDGDAIPTTTVRDDSADPEPLTIEPGASVWAQLHWTVVPGEEDPANGACGPEPAMIEVIPPDEYSATTADWSLGTVCGEGRIETAPLTAGGGPG